MFASFALLASSLLASSAVAAPVVARGGSRMTYYDTSVGLGSCGVLHQNSEYTVALNQNDMNAYGSSYPSPACGKQISITYGGKTVQATIQDTCPTCPSGGLDLSEGLFSALADQSVGVIYADWSYGSGGGSQAEPTTKEAEPTTTWTPEPTTSTKAAQPTTTWTPEATTTTWEAPAETTAAAAAVETTAAAEPTAEEQASATSTESPAAAAESSPLFTGTWAEYVQQMTCPNETLILWNNTEVIFNGTYSVALNGSNTLSGNSSSVLINTLLPNVTEFCFNATMSPFNATEVFANATANATVNSTVLFGLFTAPNTTATFF